MTRAAGDPQRARTYADVERALGPTKSRRDECKLSHPTHACTNYFRFVNGLLGAPSARPACRLPESPARTGLNERAKSALRVIAQ